MTLRRYVFIARYLTTAVPVNEGIRLIDPGAGVIAPLAVRSRGRLIPLIRLAPAAAAPPPPPASGGRGSAGAAGRRRPSEDRLSNEVLDRACGTPAADEDAEGGAGTCADECRFRFRTAWSLA